MTDQPRRISIPEQVVLAQVTKLTSAPTLERSNNDFILEAMKSRYPERKITLADIEKTKSENQKKRQALLGKYQQLYPDAQNISGCLLELSRLDGDFETCKNCTGYPCKKNACKGHKPTIKIFNGEMQFQYVICKHYQAAHQQAIANRRFKSAKIPPMYVGKTFADYTVDAANKNSVAWAKKLESLYLFGRPGTGKTFLAAIMAQELLKQGKSVIFGDVPSLLDTLKGTFDDNSDAKLEDLMQTLSSVDVLILDDFGTETPTEWAVERLYLIVNNRYNAGKMLIVTSNYDPDAAENRLNNPKAKGRSSSEGVTGSRIISRIKQMCKLTTLGGNDRRARS